MWKVLFTEQCEREVYSLFKRGLLTEEDRRVISIWIKQVKQYGPDSLCSNPNMANWNDHSLDKKWSGHRASSFSFSGRIIYKVKGRILTVFVIRVIPDHNYS